MISYSIYVTNTPPLVNCANPETKTEFVLFFSNDYFGITGVAFLHRYK